MARALAVANKKVEALNERVEKARKTYETVASACTAKMNQECLSRSELVKEYERLIYGCELQQNDIMKHKRTGDIAIVLLVLNHIDEVHLGLDYRAATGMCHGKDYKLRSVNKPGWEKIGHKPRSS